MKLPRYIASNVPRGPSTVRVDARGMAAAAYGAEQAKNRSFDEVAQGLDVAKDYAFRETQERYEADARIQLSKMEAEQDSFALNMQKQMQDAPVKTMEVRREMHKQYMAELDKYREAKRKEYDNKDALEAEEGNWAQRRNRHDYTAWSGLSQNLDRYERQNAEDIIRNRIKNGNPAQAEKDADYFVSRQLLTEEEADNIIKHQAADTEARGMLAEGKDFEEVRAFIMKQPIDTNIKKKLVSDIGFEASQQKLAYDQQLEQIEVDYLKRLGQEQLSEDELMADLQAGRIDTDLYKEYSNYVDAQVKERLKGEQERDWDEYDRLQGMVKDYGDGARTDERAIRDAISDAVKAQKITSTDGMKLLDRVKKSDDTDDQMNRSDVKRGQKLLNDLMALELKEAETTEDIIRIHKKYLKDNNEYEKSISETENLTNKDVEDIINQAVKARTEDVVPGMIERAFSYLGTLGTPFGAQLRALRKGAKPKGEPAEDISQLTDEELEAELEKLK